MTDRGVAVGARRLKIHDRIVTPSVTDYAVALNADAFGAGDDLVLTFAVDETFVPVLVGRGGDRRELGFRAHHVFLEPR